MGGLGWNGGVVGSSLGASVDGMLDMIDMDMIVDLDIRAWYIQT